MNVKEGETQNPNLLHASYTTEHGEATKSDPGWTDKAPAPGPVLWFGFLRAEQSRAEL